MNPTLDTKTLDAVFSTRPDILVGIRQAADVPNRITLFNQIASFVGGLLEDSAEPGPKRRRIDAGQAGKPGSSTELQIRNNTNAASENVLIEVKDISVLVPQRKKLTLCLTATFLYAKLAGTSEPVPGMVYPWKDIAHVFCVPIPDKPKATYNYIIIPRGSALPSSKNAPPANEPLCFSISPREFPPETLTGPDVEKSPTRTGETYDSLFDWAMEARLEAAGNATRVSKADPKFFHGGVPQPRNPNDHAVHVMAYLGTKDGLLYFFPQGILWGFRKPIMFIPLEKIVAITFTNVLQRTFNLVVEILVVVGEGEPRDDTEEIELSMLDQRDYGCIDRFYVQRFQLQNKSMAEKRKAKPALAENAVPAGNGREDAAGGATAADESASNGLTELQQAELEAERRLQDEEDELEEDFIPDADDDDDDDGESSSDEDDDADGADTSEPEDDDEDACGDEEEGQGEEAGAEMVKGEGHEGRDGEGRAETKTVTAGFKAENHEAMVVDEYGFATEGMQEDFDEEERFDVGD